MIGRSIDLSRDPINRAWDAILASTQAPAELAEQSEFQILQRFQALDTTEGPDDRFVERLSQQLKSLDPAQPNQLASLAVLPQPKSLPLRRDSQIGSAPHRRWIMALAAALAILIGGIGFLWLASSNDDPEERSIPAAVVESTPAKEAAAEGTPTQLAEQPGADPETLLSAVFDPAIIGATGQESWHEALTFIQPVAEGESFGQRGADSGEAGLSTILVIDGELTATSSGTTLVYRAGKSERELIDPDTELVLSTGDSWISSMQDVASIGNASSAPATFMRYCIGKTGEVDFFDFNSTSGPVKAEDPDGLHFREGPITIELQRIALSQDESFGIAISADDSLLMLSRDASAVRITKDGTKRGASTNAPVLNDYPPGAYTISRALGGTAELYLTRAHTEEAAAKVDATPASASVQPENLLSTLVDPASIGATGQADWDASMEYMLDIAPGKSYGQNGARTGDIGLSTILVIEGEYTAVSSGPSLFYRGGTGLGEPVAANTELMLSVGDPWIASLADTASATNDGDSNGTLLRYCIGHPGSDTYFHFSSPPQGGYPFAHDPEAPPSTVGPVAIELQRLSLEKGELYGVEISADESYLLLSPDSGAVQITRDGTKRGAPAFATALNHYPPGTYTISRAVGGTAELYLARAHTQGTEAKEDATTASASVRPENLLSAQIDPASVGATGQANWDTSFEHVLKIAAGESFEQDGAATGDIGLLTIVVIEGEYTAVSSGPSLIYRAGKEVGEQLPANTELMLSADDVWISSLAETASATNDSATQGSLLRYCVGHPGTDTNFYFSSAQGGHPFALDLVAPHSTSGPIAIDLQRLLLEKGESYGVEISADESFLLLSRDSAAVQIAKVGTNRGAPAFATALNHYPPGTYTISRDLGSTAEIYLTRWHTETTTAAKVTAVVPAVRPETLLSATIDSTALDAEAQSNWNFAGLFNKSGLHPGQEISLDASNWGAGLTVTTVLDGTLTLTAQGPIEVIRSGEQVGEVVRPSETVELQAGDSVSLDASKGVQLRNDTEADVSFLTLVAFDAPDQFFPDVPYPENSWGPLAPLVDLDLSQQFDGPVEISFERVALGEDESIELQLADNELLFYSTADGSALQYARSDSSRPIVVGTSVLHDKGPGDYTLTRLASSPIDVYIVRMRDASG